VPGTARVETCRKPRARGGFGRGADGSARPAAQGARPHYQYQAFCSATDALTRGGGPVGERGILIPSPLLRPTSPLVRLYFQMADDKTLASPQVPTGPMRSLAAGGYVADEAIRQAAERLVAMEKAILPAGASEAQAGRLVENVLAYSRLEGRRFAAQGQTVATGPWLEQVRPGLERRAEQAGMELVVTVEPDAAKAAVAAEATALEQIVANLVDNACKYAAGAVDRRIHVGLGRAGGDVLLSVRDHGPGIGAQELDKIFRPFVRAGRDVAGPSGGLGLGLAISRRLARALGGDLTAQGADGGGTRFTLRLPGAAMPH